MLSSENCIQDALLFAFRNIKEKKELNNIENGDFIFNFIACSMYTNMERIN